MAVYDKVITSRAGVPTDSYSTCAQIPVATPWTIVRPVFKTTLLGGPPTFTLQPLSQEAEQGATVQFTVATKGAQPITYQWRKDGVPIVGETSATLTLTAVEVDAEGIYDVVATNPAGSTPSDPATLTVEGEAVIAIYLGNAGPDAQPAYSLTQILSLEQTPPHLNPVYKGTPIGVYEISSPQSGQNEYRVMAFPAWFPVTSGDFRSGGSALPMDEVQNDLIMENGDVYRVFRTSNRSAGDFTQAGNTAITVVAH